MNAAMGRNAMDGRFGRIGKYAARAGVLALGAALLLGLGGCKNQQHEDQVTALNAEISQLQDEKSSLSTQNSSLQTQLAAAQAEAQRKATPPSGPGTGGDTGNVRPGPERDVVITVAGDVLFASGQATLKAEAKKELDRVASRLKSEFSGHSFRVEGYTDTDPPNKMKKVYPTNEALSQARAEAVEKYLVSKGISSGRITSVGMGSAKAKSTKAASRRVEIVVMGN